MRIYDPRVGKFLSVDPLMQKFPFYSPYQFSGNKPIWAVDLDGQEDVYYTINIVTNGLGQTKLRSITEDEAKAVHWWNNNETGKLGKGALFSYRIQNQDMDGKPISLVTKHVFVPKITFADKLSHLILGDESMSENVGYVILGMGKNMQSMNRIPKAAFGSETLDMGGWVDLASGYREGLGVHDLAEEFSKSLKLIESVQKIVQVTDAAEKIQNANGGDFPTGKKNIDGLDEKPGPVNDTNYAPPSGVMRDINSDIITGYTRSRTQTIKSADPKKPDTIRTTIYKKPTK